MNWQTQDLPHARENLFNVFRISVRAKLCGDDGLVDLCCMIWKQLEKKKTWKCTWIRMLKIILTFLV